MRCEKIKELTKQIIFFIDFSAGNLVKFDLVNTTRQSKTFLEKKNTRLNAWTNHFTSNLQKFSYVIRKIFDRS